jgi:hypothetical protein
MNEVDKNTVADVQQGAVTREQAWQPLMQTVQNLLQAQAISDTDIEAEIDAVRQAR